MNDSPLILQNFRVRGLGDVIESSWVEVGPNATFFRLPYDFNRRGFLQALQTANPPFDCQHQEPFLHYPLITRQGKFTKRVRPHRRTISFAIFIAQPRIVEELAAFTPHLYEADRIEVGRRLDYSRWVNFVEIAGSTRWSEVEDKIKALATAHEKTLGAQLHESIFSSLSATDRITDSLLEDLGRWLRALVEKKRAKQGEIEQLLFLVERQQHFNDAKKFIRRRLPLFHLVNRQQIVNGKRRTAHKKMFSAVCEYIDSLLQREEKQKKPSPVFLFDEPDIATSTKDRRELRQYIAEISLNYQCLYMAAEEHGGEVPTGARCVTTGDLILAERE